MDSEFGAVHLPIPACRLGRSDDDGDTVESRWRQWQTGTTLNRFLQCRRGESSANANSHRHRDGNSNRYPERNIHTDPDAGRDLANPYGDCVVHRSAHSNAYSDRYGHRNGDSATFTHPGGNAHS
jgi:hypothetical protein